MPTWLIVTGLVALGVIVLVTILRVLKLHVRHKLMTEINTRFAGQTILCQALGANFFGQASRGMAQIRGNGALVLTRRELYFRMLLPKREWTIPLETIRDVSLVKSHLGKTVFMDLVKVDYLSDQGDDAAAWAVRDPDHWLDEIRQAVAEITQSDDTR